MDGIGWGDIERDGWAGMGERLTGMGGREWGWGGIKTG